MQKIFNSYTTTMFSYVLLLDFEDIFRNFACHFCLTHTMTMKKITNTNNKRI